MAKKQATADNRARSTPATRPGSSGQTDNKAETHRVEWILGTCAGLVILAIVGFLILEALTRAGGKPDLSLQTVARRDTAAGMEVVIEVRNDGQATASSVAVAGSTDGQSWRQVTLDYAPGHSRREVTLVFPSGAFSASPEIEIVGYVQL